MSTTSTDGVTESEFGSLARAVAQRRRERERKRQEPIILPIPGYSDLFAVQYRRLLVSERVEIVEKFGPDDPRLAAPSSLLINACEDILKVAGTGEDDKPLYEPTGKKWTLSTVKELFDAEFPEGTTALGAMLEVLDESELSLHIKQYTDALNLLETGDRKATPGES